MTDADWLKGHHADHDVFVIEVLVRKDRFGQLASHGRLQSEEDRKVAETLPSGGMVEGGWALLTEAVRTEMTLQLLVRLSNDPSFREKLLEGDSPSEEILNMLERDATNLVNRELREILPSVARAVTGALRNGLRDETE